MGLVINHNLMAMTAARNLTNIYGKLATSTQRLSSGLRINSAADDAAGLAIREMMRADIAALNQGLRNAADGISMIQTAEGALSVIDEKLIRMKELAEQASTGTYTTAQREIMNSEYQAMANEIDRIANATDFNGIKLLDGSVANEHQARGLKIHFGTGNDEAEDYYFVKLGDARATEATGLRVGGDAKNDIWGQAGTNGAGADGCCNAGVGSLTDAAGWSSGNVFAYGYNWDWKEDDDVDLDNYYYTAGMYEVGSGASLQDLVNEVNKGTQSRVVVDFAAAGTTGTALINRAQSGSAFQICVGDYAFTWGTGAGAVSGKTTIATGAANSARSAAAILVSAINNSSANTVFWAAIDDADASKVAIFFKEGGDNNSVDACDIGINTISADGLATSENLVTWEHVETKATNSAGTTFSLGGQHWATMQAEQISQNQGNEGWNVSLHGRDVGDERDLRILNVGSASSSDIQFSLGTNQPTNIAGFNRAAFSEIQNAADGDWAAAEIRSQSSAQEALTAIDDAISKKDKIRADLGALQNRLENTMTNISIQAEMLQASESRISDVDVALEMTEFTKNNIMAQAATSMLAQANSLAQLALSLLG